MSTDTAPAFIAPDDVAELVAQLPEPEPVEAAPLAPDTAPAKRKSRSGTSRAQRKAKAEGTAPAPASGDRAPRAPRRSGGMTAEERARAATTVEALHELIGSMVMPNVGLPVTGATLTAAGPDAAQVWVKVAQRYPAVARMLTASGDGMVYLQLFMVYAPLVSLAMTEARGELAGVPVPAAPSS